MIRPFTCLSLFLALGSGLVLYQEKHRTVLLDRQLAHVMRDAEAARARIGVLQAEWALMNSASRLQDLAGRYLHLEPLAPTQFVQLAALDAHLPPVQTAPDPGQGTDEDEAPPLVAAADAPPLAPLAMIQPPHHAAPDTVKPRPEPHIALAQREPAPHATFARGQRLPLAQPRPMGATVLSAMARPVAPAERAAPRVLPVTAAYVGSALGGRVALPPPVPLSPGDR
jgi:hypothetical protein